MTLFQGSDNDFWMMVSGIAALMTAAAIWYIVIIGRDRPTQHMRKSESQVVKYADLEEGRAPLSKFIVYTIFGVAIWGVGYLLWTGINGVTGYR
jgi:membrane protein DedA with SNARE-associated domain